MKIHQKFFNIITYSLLLIGTTYLISCSDDPAPALQLTSLKSGTVDLISTSPATNVNVNNNIVATFAETLDEASVTTTIVTLSKGSTSVDIQVTVSAGGITIDPILDLQAGSQHSLTIGAVRSVTGLVHATRTITFTTAP